MVFQADWIGSGVSEKNIHIYNDDFCEKLVSRVRSQGREGGLGRVPSRVVRLNRAASAGRLGAPLMPSDPSTKTHPTNFTP